MLPQVLLSVLTETLDSRALDGNAAIKESFKHDRAESVQLTTHYAADIQAQIARKKCQEGKQQSATAKQSKQCVATLVVLRVSPLCWRRGIQAGATRGCECLRPTMP